jgi:hypothetical protein
MAKSKNPKMGRPKKPIDWTELDKLLAIHCTQSEVCAWLDISDETLNVRCKKEKGMTFLEYSRQKTKVGKMSLRRRQYTKAVEEGNTTMLIWLGKQWLDQTDKAEYKAEIRSPNTSGAIEEILKNPELGKAALEIAEKLADA